MKILYRYLLFLITIAVAFVFMYLVVDKNIKDQDPSGSLVNISGRQRMLSQKVLSKAYELYSYPSDSLLVYEDLGIPELLEHWGSVHDLLLEKSIEFDDSIAVKLLQSSKIHQNKVFEILTAFNHSERHRLNQQEIAYLKSDLNSYLLLMERIVLQFDKRVASELERLASTGLFLLVFGFILILASFVLVFIPLFRHIKLSNAKLKDNVKETNFLLHELEHRVKNNLQELSSIINIQAIQGDCDHMQLQNRINALGLVHDLLCKNDNKDHIDLMSYLSELIKQLNQDNLTIKLSLNNFDVSAKFALDLGFCINELFTNAIKYSNKESLELNISVTNQNDVVELVFGDNGPGYDEQSIKRGLGLNLINDFVRKYQGSLMKRSGDGTCYEIKLKHTKDKFHGTAAMIS